LPPFVTSLRQIDENIGRAVAIRHGPICVADIRRRQRANVQGVDRCAGSRGVAGINVGVGVEHRRTVVRGRGTDIVDLRRID